MVFDYQSIGRLIKVFLDEFKYDDLMKIRKCLKGYSVMNLRTGQTFYSINLITPEKFNKDAWINRQEAYEDYKILLDLGLNKDVSFYISNGKYIFD